MPNMEELAQELEKIDKDTLYAHFPHVRVISWLSIAKKLLEKYNITELPPQSEPECDKESE